MKSLSPTQIERAHALSDEFNALFALAEATEHPLERDQVHQQIIGLVQQASDNTVKQLALEIIEAKISEATIEFIDAVPHFFDSPARAFKAAESTDLVLRLRHEQGLFLETASVEMAARAHALFRDVALANPLPNDLNNLNDGGADAPPENGSAVAAESSGTTDTHEEQRKA